MLVVVPGSDETDTTSSLHVNAGISNHSIQDVVVAALNRNSPVSSLSTGNSNELHVHHESPENSIPTLQSDRTD